MSGYIGPSYNQSQVDAYKSAATIKTAADKAKNIQKTAIKNAQNTLDAAVSKQKKAKQDLKTAEGVLSAISTQLNEYKTSNPAAYDLLLPDYNAAKVNVNKERVVYSDATKKVDVAQKVLNEVSKTGNNAYKNFNNTKTNKNPIQNGTYLNFGKFPNKPNKPGVYIYNAPMMFGNNFHGIQANTIDPQYVLPGNYGDAMEAWTNKTPSGRGAFQVDRQTNTAEAIALAPKNAASTSVPDNTKYGFKFLYNPNTVTMSWGSVMATDPVFEASGKDQFIPGTANLVSSNIDFSLVINRIQDFALIDANGLKNADQNPYGVFATKTGNANDEFKQIYEKGTMYDIEYLFRTMHGSGAYVSYKSVLQGGVTADPGWLPVRPIELHLGNKLRYRVRIQSLSVNHTIFNARMVPILTTINVSCARYWDGGTYVNKASL
jgi:hypothetical protein